MSDLELQDGRVAALQNSKVAKSFLHSVLQSIPQSILPFCHSAILQ